MKKLLLAGLLFLGVPSLLIILVSQSQATQFLDLLRANETTFLVSLLVGKSISIVYPPLPGAVLTMGSIPIVGWQRAYLVDIFGSSFGATAAYFLGRKYGVKLLRWAVGEKIANKVLGVKIKKRNQVETTFMLRLASGGILSDGLAWGASLIGLRYPAFIIGYLMSHLLTTLPIFYFLSVSIELKSWIVAIPAAVIAWFLIYKLKGRYFE
jgi:uncharacterized membrane protein YdjX (TVP38/TMEM64 family)